MIPAEILIPYLESYKALKKWALEPSGEGTFRICCPFHEDEKPSGTIYIESGSFVCRAASCGRKTDLASMLAGLLSAHTGKPVTRDAIISELARKYNLEKPGEAPLASEPILRAHKTLLDELDKNDIIKAFLNKGVSLDTIKKYKIGFREGRIIIPILNDAGTGWINERRYLPNAPGPEKMRNSPGRGEPKIFPIDQLRFKRLVVTGGECKAMVGAQCLNKHSIGAVTMTGSEGSWNRSYNDQFKGKIVYVIMDVDRGGITAAKTIAKTLYRYAEQVFICNLPLDTSKHPKGDINDFVMEGGDLLTVVETCAEEYVPQASANLESLTEGEYDQQTISGAISAKSIGRRSAVDVTIVGVGEQRFSVPKTVRVACNLDQDHCASCNVYGRQKAPKFSIPIEHPAVIAMCDSTDAQLASRLRTDIIGIPSKCKSHTLIIEERQGAEIAVVSQPTGIEATQDADTRQVQKVLFIGDGQELNTTVRLYARAQPDPKTQEAVLITGQVDRLADALDSAEVNIDDLNIFQPEDDSLEALEAKLNEIADDLSCNVTKIYQRPDLHRVVDMVAHSPLYIDLEGTVHKGWVEGLIIGDTGQGKSKCALSLSKHYGAGHVVDCANVSVAGLLGGNQQLAGMWVTTWGAFPTHDRKWVVLEELKRAPVEVIAACTETRSSGIVKISKIRAGSRPARVRLLAVSNTRSDRFLRTYGSGVDAVLELIGQPEDVRRFDICFAVSADDIQGDVIHATSRPTARHRLTSSICHRLIQWVWTRQAKHVVIQPDVKDTIFAQAQILAETYVDTVPIVDRGTIRLKLARLAAALACRTYSTRDGINVDVQRRHVISASKFLQHIYDGNAMGYKRYSERHQASTTLTDKKRTNIISAISNQIYAGTLAEYLATRSNINDRELGTLAAMANDEVRGFLGVLLRNGGIEYRGQHIIISSALRELVRTYEFKDAEPEV